MTLAWSLAILYWLALVGLGLAAFALFRARRLSVFAEVRLQTELQQYQTSLDSLRRELEQCVQQVRELERHLGSDSGGAPGRPRTAMNLTKRSQALRMHRRGEPVDRIATALEIPAQELDLLLKVHRIVINRM